MFYCHKCNCSFVIKRTVKDCNGNIVFVYECPKCHRIKYM